MIRPSIIIIAGLMMINSPALYARIIHVPDDFETIQAAIDDASADEVDTVMLDDGTYSGNGNINLAINRELVLTSVNGALETIIDCEDAANSRAIFPTTSVTIIGLTITRAKTNGIRVDNAQRLLIEKCRFIANVGNVNQQSGGGIQLRTCSGTIKDCIFENNSNIGSGGAVVINTSQINFEGCLFRSNHAERFGGALLVTNNSQVSIFNCLFVGNTAGIDGGGIAHSLTAQSTISFCTILENEAAGLGGGIYKGSNSNPTVINSIFWGNRAQTGDQLAAQDNGGEITISYCLVEGGPDQAGRWDGENIIEDEPVLTDGRDPAWGWNGFYLNQEESPAVDAGSDGAEELGVNIFSTDPDLRNDQDQADLGFHYWIGWVNIFGRLYGRVVDLTDDAPIAGARVTTTLNQSAITEEDGNWEFPEARVGLFDITAEKPYFSTMTISDQELEEDAEVELIFRLPHPEFRVSEEALTAEIGVDDTAEVTFQVINDGNGPMIWSSYIRLRDEENQDLWESRATFTTGNDVQDSRVTGVAFDGENYYASGADGDEPSKIYVLDAEGSPVREFVQPGSARFGMRDLAWDGELLWGASNEFLIGFTTEGDSITSFRGPANPTFSVTWDTDRELIWASAITTDIFGYDREGNQVARLNHGVMRTYGLAHWSGDPDGATLYVHGNSAAEPGPQVFKVNPDNNEITHLVTLDVLENSSPEGAEIISGVDPYAITLIAVYNYADGDYINFWRASKRDGWFSLEPDRGNLDGGEAIDVNLTLLSQGFDEGMYQAEAHFAYDAAGDSSTVPIQMEVVGGAVHAVRAVPLPMGWSLVSSHIQPDDADIQVIMQPLVDEGKLMFMKDTEGRIYAPRLDEPYINMLPWDVERAYWVKLTSPGVLRLEGLTVSSDQPLQLREGWNGVAYLPRVVMDPVRAFAGIIDEVRLVRDGEGRFMLPRYDFSNLLPCRPGNGYLVRVSQHVEFIWGGEPQNDFVLPQQQIERLPRWFEVPKATGFTMSMLILGDGQDGLEIAVKCGDRIVGGGVISGGMCGIAIAGDDPLTADIEGAIDGEILTLVSYSSSEVVIISPKLIEGELSFKADGLAVALLSSPIVPESALLIDAFPNPFNSTTLVSVSFPAAGEVSVTLFDTEGRTVAKVFEGPISAGQRRFAVDGGQLSTGLYFLTAESRGMQATARLLLIR